MPYKDAEKVKEVKREWARRTKVNNPWPRREVVWRQQGIDFDRHRFLQMYADQVGHCAICQDEITLSASADHDHETGKVRGLLCAFCNHMLGFAKDSAAILAKGACYLNGNNH